MAVYGLPWADKCHSHSQLMMLSQLNWAHSSIDTAETNVLCFWLSSCAGGRMVSVRTVANPLSHKMVLESYWWNEERAFLLLLQCWSGGMLPGAEHYTALTWNWYPLQLIPLLPSLSPHVDLLPMHQQWVDHCLLDLLEWNMVQSFLEVHIPWKICFCSAFSEVLSSCLAFTWIRLSLMICTVISLGLKHFPISMTRHKRRSPLISWNVGTLALGRQRGVPGLLEGEREREEEARDPLDPREECDGLCDIFRLRLRLSGGIGASTINTPSLVRCDFSFLASTCLGRSIFLLYSFSIVLPLPFSSIFSARTIIRSPSVDTFTFLDSKSETLNLSLNRHPESGYSRKRVFIFFSSRISVLPLLLETNGSLRSSSLPHCLSLGYKWRNSSRIFSTSRSQSCFFFFHLLGHADFHLLKAHCLASCKCQPVVHNGHWLAVFASCRHVPWVLPVSALYSASLCVWSSCHSSAHLLKHRRIQESLLR